MEAKEKALELINKFKPHSYNGTPEEDEEFRQWLITVDDDETEIEDLYKEFLVEKLNNNHVEKLNNNAKQCVIKVIDEIKSFLPFTDLNTSLGKYCVRQIEFLDEVKKELDKL